MMLERFRQSIGLRYARFHFRREQEEMRPLTKFFTSARRLLLVLPFNDADASYAHNIVGEFAKVFGSRSIVLLASRSIHIPSTVDSARVIFLGKEQRSLFFIPRRSTIEQLQQIPFDVAVDLNQVLVLPVAFLLKALRVPYRVGFDNSGMREFYNVFVRVSTTDPLQRYALLLNQLLMF
jgi:hypothetical protein